MNDMIIWLVFLASGMLLWESFVAEPLRRQLRAHRVNAKLVDGDVRRRGGRASIWL